MPQAEDGPECVVCLSALPSHIFTPVHSRLAALLAEPTLSRAEPLSVAVRPHVRLRGLRCPDQQQTAAAVPHVPGRGHDRVSHLRVAGTAMHSGSRGCKTDSSFLQLWWPSLTLCSVTCVQDLNDAWGDMLHTDS